MRQKEYKRKILIDAAQKEETRVAVLGERDQLEELDFELLKTQQLKGNIYLAKVIRIEPSLQAAFVEYGGNRHGFLSFAEIHPDYFRIPVADREKLKEMQIEEAQQLKEAEEFDDHPENLINPDQPDPSEMIASTEDSFHLVEADKDALDLENEQVAPVLNVPDENPSEEKPKKRGRKSKKEKEAEEIAAAAKEANKVTETTEAVSEEIAIDKQAEKVVEKNEAIESLLGGSSSETIFDVSSLAFKSTNQDFLSSEPFAPPVEGEQNPFGDFEHVTPDLTTSSEPKETSSSRQGRSNHLRRRRPQQRQSAFSLHKMYKIQEVLQKGQVLLIQVVKEERQNKGAAVTTYLSLPGRYCVLMPNNPRGGGISRKITDISMRRKLREMINDLEIPKGMGVIIRTAGIDKSKTDINRDFDYLFRLWDKIREETLVSTAPALIYEEGNLIKRSIRDLYSKGVDEIIVEGEKGYETAKNFIRMLIPSKARQVTKYKDEHIPLFTKYALEKQLEAIHDPIVRLKSGGYLVINATEALIAIDINSGRSTKERNIRETAFNTNLEAAREIPRQLRLRDLAGLVVIDFIDMDHSRHNAQVEKAFREGVRGDRAKVQVGNISQFGLLELSRQRLRPSIFETHFNICPACNGNGVVKTDEAAALSALRECHEIAIQDPSIERIDLTVPPQIILYILNHKRVLVTKIEESCQIALCLSTSADSSQLGHVIKVTKSKKVDENKKNEPKKLQTQPQPQNQDPAQAEEQVSQQSEESAEKENTKPRRRRGRRPRKTEGSNQNIVVKTEDDVSMSHEQSKDESSEENKAQNKDQEKPQRQRRRRHSSENKSPQKIDTLPALDENKAQRDQKQDIEVKEAVKPSEPEIVNLNDGVVKPAKKGPKKKGWWGNLIS